MPRTSPALLPPAMLATAGESGYLILVDAPGQVVAADLARRMQEIMAERPGEVDASGGAVHLHGIEGDTQVRAAFDHPAILHSLRVLLGVEPHVRAIRYRSPKPDRGTQALHRDEPWPHPDGRWATATVIIGLVEFSATNGATRLVPGSHRDRAPFVAHGPSARHLGEILLTGPPGGAYIFTGACLHSGTLNTSGADRPGVQATFSGVEPAVRRPPQ